MFRPTGFAEKRTLSVNFSLIVKNAATKVKKAAMKKTFIFFFFLSRLKKTKFFSLNFNHSFLEDLYAFNRLE